MFLQLIQEIFFGKHIKLHKEFKKNIQVLKNEGVKKDTVDGEEERIEAAINTSIQNRDLNEPVNREAIKAEYTPTK